MSDETAAGHGRPRMLSNAGRGYPTPAGGRRRLGWARLSSGHVQGDVTGCQTATYEHSRPGVYESGLLREISG